MGYDEAMTLRISFCSLAFLLALPSGPAAATPTAAVGDAPPSDELPPPPGSPEDQALWRAGGKVSEQIILERTLANKLQWQIRQGRYQERLAALAKQAPPSDSERVEALNRRFGQALAFNYATLTRQWPVDPTRGCRYQVLHLEGVLADLANPRRATQLLIVREELKDCVDRALPALKVMADSNLELRRVAEEVASALPPLPAAAVAPGSTPAPGDPAPPAANASAGKN